MPGHGFTNVDGQVDPGEWIAVLDRLRAAPEYAAYKLRVGELLQPRAGGRYLDVGTGTGSDALAVAARFDMQVVGVDLSRAMVDEARRRGLRDALVADACALPFGDGSFEGCWADRTLQHVADPVAALCEMVRVAKAGGRVVVADPDYDTQVVEVENQELARRVLRFRADRLLRNGTLAHRMAGLFADAGLSEVSVEGFSIVLRDPTALDNAMGLRTWAEVAHQRGHLTVAEARTWENEIDAAVEGQRFLYAFTLFVTAGTKPGA